jgi:hypothetical protein
MACFPELVSAEESLVGCVYLYELKNATTLPLRASKNELSVSHARIK